MKTPFIAWQGIGNRGRESRVVITAPHFASDGPLRAVYEVRTTNALGEPIWSAPDDLSERDLLAVICDQAAAIRHFGMKGAT